MATETQVRLTEEEYLALEEKSECKHEYLNGEIFEMPGATQPHLRLSMKINRRLSEQLEGSECEPYASDCRVRVEAGGLYTYPDLVVACREATFLDAAVGTLVNPTLILEILSPSTEAYDRGRKFEHYRKIAALQEYVLVDQSSMKIEVFRRQPDGTWLLHVYTEPTDEARLESIGCSLKLADVYAGVF